MIARKYYYFQRIFRKICCCSLVYPGAETAETAAAAASLFLFQRSSISHPIRGEERHGYDVAAANARGGYHRHEYVHINTHTLTHTLRLTYFHWSAGKRGPLLHTYL